MNPAVLGGVVVDFGDKTIDLSVVSRVNKLNNLLQRECTFQRTLSFLNVICRVCMSGACYIEDFGLWHIPPENDALMLRTRCSHNLSANQQIVTFT